MKMVCIGVKKHRLLKFLNREGCGQKWDYDTKDGLCPICRGYLVPESLIKNFIL